MGEGRPLTSAPADPLPDAEAAVPLDDTIEPGKRLIRLPADKGLSLGDRIANHITRLTWRTPLHAFRLKGRFPLKLLGVPEDPVPGDMTAGTRIRARHLDRTTVVEGTRVSVRVVLGGSHIINKNNSSPNIYA